MSSTYFTLKESFSLGYSKATCPKLTEYFIYIISSSCLFSSCFIINKQ